MSQTEIEQPEVPAVQESANLVPPVGVWTRWAPWLVAVGSALAYTTFAFNRYWQRDLSWDSAVLGQAVAAYGRLETPVADTLGPGVNQLSDHFSPILAVLGPVYSTPRSAQWHLRRRRLLD